MAHTKTHRAFDCLNLQTQWPISWTSKETAPCWPAQSVLACFLCITADAQWPLEEWMLKCRTWLHISCALIDKNSLHTSSSQVLRSHSGQQQEIGYAGQLEHHTVPICSQWAAACLKPSPEDITNELRADCGHLKHYIWEKELIKYALVWALKLIFCVSYVMNVCSIMQTPWLRYVREAVC